MVPLMMVAMRMPAHLATATSSFAIVLTSPTGVLTHFFVARHTLEPMLELSAILAACGILGGRAGAQLAPRVNARQITYLLIVVLLGAAASLIGRHLVQPEYGRRRDAA